MLQENQREPLPAFDDILRKDTSLPTMTRWRWLNAELPRSLRWLLENPAAARAIAQDAEQRARRRSK